MVRWAEQRIREADIDDALFEYSAGKLGADVIAKGTLGALS